MNFANQKKTFLLMAAGCACLLAGCGSEKGIERDYSKYIDLAPYTGQTVSRYLPAVTDEDVQAYIEDDLLFNAEYNDVTDRAAQIGDIAVVDYTGTIDGQKFEGGSETDAQIELGSGDYIDGFEDEIVGMKIGEEKDFDVVFPTPYDGVLDGQTATFHATLTSLIEVTLPEYNDEYVSSVSEYSTTDEYEASIREELAQTNLDDANETACEELLSSVITNSVFKETPEDLRAACEEAQQAENEDLIEVFGFDDVSDLYGDDYSPEAELEEMVHERMVVYTIAAKEKIKVSDEEYKAALEEDMAYSDYSSPEEYESEMVSSPANYKYSILRGKVMEFLAQNNGYNDVSEDEYYADDADILELDGDASDLEEESTDAESAEAQSAQTEAESAAETETGEAEAES